MKTLRKICISLLISIAALTAVTADTIENISNFTPDRPGIPYVEGISGLTYPSFNNFTNNPNIKATGGDERKFLTGRLCDGPCTDGGSYSNTTEQEPKDGDHIRFRVYFHNNGIDSHDGDNTTSPDATNVQVGIDLNNIQDPNKDFIKRPKGFIFADNNQYRTNTADPNTVIKNTSGNIERTATDDMQVTLPEGYSLELVKNSGQLKIAKNDTEVQVLKINGSTTFTIKAIDGTSIPITANTKIENNKIWITFDKMPGCFRYSGFVYFDAKITKKPEIPEEKPGICKDLKLTSKDAIVNGKKAHELSATFTLENPFVGIKPMIHWTSTDANAVFQNSAGEEIGTGEAFSIQGEKIYYFSDAKIEAEVTNVSAKVAPFDFSKCKAELEFPKQPPQVCEDLKVNYQKEIIEGTISKFVAKSEDTEGKTFNGKITYSVDPAYGTFYTYNPGGQVTNTSPEVKEFDNTKPIQKPIGGFCPDKQAVKQDSGTPNTDAPATGEPTATGTFSGGNLTGIDVSTTIKIIGDLATGNFNYKVPLDIDKKIQELNINTYIPGKVDWPVGTGPDPSPEGKPTGDFKFGQMSVIAAVDNPFGGDYPKAEDGTKFKTPLDFSKYGASLDPNYIPKVEKQPIIDPNILFGGANPKIELLLPSYFQSGSKITVDPGTVVYFVAKKPGTNVIKVSTECTDKCKREFSINPVPKQELVCKAVTFTANIGKTVVSKLQTDKTHLLKAEFFYDTAKTQKIPSQNVEVRWLSTDPTGLFFTPTDLATDKNGHTSPFIGPNVVAYKGNGEVTAELVKVDGKPVDAPKCKANISSEKNICKSLEIVSLPTEPLEVGQDAILRIFSKDASGKSLPAETKVIWGTTTEGTLNFGEKSSTTNLPLTHGNQPVNFKNSKKEGTVTLKLDPTDPLYSAACADAIAVVKKPTPAVCTGLAVYLDGKIFNENDLLKPANVYTLTADASYSGAKESQKVTYTIPSSYGVFIDPTAEAVVKNTIITSSKADGMSQAGVIKQFISSGGLKSSVEVTDGTEVILLTFKDVSQTSEKILTVKASGTTEAICEKKFGIDVPKPPVEEVECSDLEIKTPNEEWIVSDKKTQTFTISVKPPELESKLYYNWVVKQGGGEWENDDDEDHDTTAGDTTNKLTGFTKTTEVEVYASKTANGAKIEKCKDTREAEDVEKDKPTIKKVVYSNKKKASDLLNIGNPTKNKFLTYQITFEAKRTLKSVEIIEEQFKGGSINSTSKKLDGTLDFKSMEIEVKGDGKDYTIFDSEDADDFDEFDCKDKDKDEDKVCIEDIEDAERNFKNGDALIFKGKITEDTKIVITVQVENKTKISESTCKDLDPDDGCGESFPNKVSFVAEDDQNEDYEGKDNAEVIAICPFILTRQGGDVFFRDVIDTGVDVAKCSKVKTSVGPGITPDYIKGEKVTSTGGTEEAPTGDLILDVPSHDICRYSNSDNNDLDAYSNVLENFSSTICEVRTEIAEDWKEVNINKAINDNITRIARWGQNLNDKLEYNTLTSVSDLSNVDNKQSGIFVMKGNLTINLSDTIYGDKNAGVPAAQTYIVKDGDLHIKSDIKYSENTDYNNPKSIPSVAFIVINGDIIIDDNVKQIDGILMAINFDETAENGKVRSNGTVSEENLVINGSLIGNVIDLFQNRIGSGDPTLDEGSVTIRYDARILLNTPPGLGELINIEQAIVPN